MVSSRMRLVAGLVADARRTRKSRRCRVFKSFQRGHVFTCDGDGARDPPARLRDAPRVPVPPRARRDAPRGRGRASRASRSGGRCRRGSLPRAGLRDGRRATPPRIVGSHRARHAPARGGRGPLRGRACAPGRDSEAGAGCAVRGGPRGEGFRGHVQRAEPHARDADVLGVAARVFLPSPAALLHDRARARRVRAAEPGGRLSRGRGRALRARHQRGVPARRRGGHRRRPEQPQKGAQPVTKRARAGRHARDSAGQVPQRARVPPGVAAPSRARRHRVRRRGKSRQGPRRGDALPQKARAESHTRRPGGGAFRFVRKRNKKRRRRRRRRARTLGVAQGRRAGLARRGRRPVAGVAHQERRLGGVLPQAAGERGGHRPGGEPRRRIRHARRHRPGARIGRRVTQLGRFAEHVPS